MVEFLRFRGRCLIWQTALSPQFVRPFLFHEPGCAVRAAVENGELPEDRYSSYIKLKKESEHHEMSHLDKRRKDKAFGKFIKTAKKQMKDKHRTT